MKSQVYFAFSLLLVHANHDSRSAKIVIISRVSKCVQQHVQNRIIFYFYLLLLFNQIAQVLISLLCLNLRTIHLNFSRAILQFYFLTFTYLLPHCTKISLHQKCNSVYSLILKLEQKIISRINLFISKTLNESQNILVQTFLHQ